MLCPSVPPPKRIRNSLPSLWSPLIILGMGVNNGDDKKPQKVCQMVNTDFDSLSHLESTALSTVSGVKIFSLTVSWRKKNIFFNISTPILRRLQSFWNVKVCSTHCGFECDRLLKTFGWHLQQLSDHPDFLCAHYRCSLLTLSLYPHKHTLQPINIISIILQLSHKLYKLIVTNDHMWVFVTKRPGVAGSRHFPDEGQRTAPCRC